MAWNRLASPESPDVVSSAILDGLDKEPKGMPNLYGDGHASEKIAQTLFECDPVTSRHSSSPSLISQASAI
jgi:hypothetical protein